MDRPFYRSQGNPDWEEWERDVAYLINTGEKVKGSGRLDMAKGDVKSHAFLIDCKYTESNGYPLSQDFWDQLSSWAMNESREPALAVRIASENGFTEIVVVSEPTYHQISKAPVRLDESGLKRQKSKKITASFGAKKPKLFQLGNRRLVAYRFADFIEDANEYEASLMVEENVEEYKGFGGNAGLEAMKKEIEQFEGR